MGFILLILLLAGGSLVYIYLANLEAQIREEIAAAEKQPHQDRPASESRRMNEDEVSLESRIGLLVRPAPEMLQADLYAQLPGVDRKMIQKTVLDLERAGRLIRVRSGKSFKLTFVD